ncbi:MAG: hypothetical protein ACTSSG_05770 [Candidatus Heimdallarchaeaceae archaeon]
MSNDSSSFLLITYLSKRSIFLSLLPFLLVSIYLGWVYQDSNFAANIFLPGEGKDSIQILEGFLLVFFAIFSGLLIIFALKHHKIRLLKYFFAGGIFLTALSSMWLHGFFLSSFFLENKYWVELLFTIFGAVIGASTIYSFILEKGGQAMKNILILILSLAIGTVFGLILQIYTFLVLVILISIFDVYSVFKGPIKYIFKESNFTMTPSLQFAHNRLLAMGIGDFIFYSTTLVFISRKLGLQYGLIAAIGILVGTKITEKLLEKHGKFPGLPIPIFSSLSLVGLGWLINTYLLSSINWLF